MKSSIFFHGKIWKGEGAKEGKLCWVNPATYIIDEPRYDYLRKWINILRIYEALIKQANLI